MQSVALPALTHYLCVCDEASSGVVGPRVIAPILARVQNPNSGPPIYHDVGNFNIISCLSSFEALKTGCTSCGRLGKQMLRV